VCRGTALLLLFYFISRTTLRSSELTFPDATLAVLNSSPILMILLTYTKYVLTKLISSVCVFLYVCIANYKAMFDVFLVDECLIALTDTRVWSLCWADNELN
jgi:hypothetical protein